LRCPRSFAARRSANSLADARPRCIRSRVPRFRIVAPQKTGAPHTLSEHAGGSLVSRNRRGGLLLRVVRDVQLRARRRASRLGYHRVHASARDPVAALVHRITAIGQPAFGPGVSSAASTLERPQVDVADHSVVMTLRLFRDTAERAACAGKVCGAPSSALLRRSIVVPAQRDARAERRRAATTARRRRTRRVGVLRNPSPTPSSRYSSRSGSQPGQS